MTKWDGHLLAKKSRAYQTYDPSRFYTTQAYVCQDEVFDASVLDDHIFVSMSGEQFQLALNRQLPTEGGYPILSGYFTDQATVDTVLTGDKTFDAVALGDKLQQNPHLDVNTGEYLYNDHLACLTIDRNALWENYHTRDFRAAMGKCLANDHLGQGGGNQGFNDLLNEMVNNGTLTVDTGRSMTSSNCVCPEDRLSQMHNNTLMRNADCRAQLLDTGTVEEPRPEICRQSSFGPPNHPVEAPPFSNENWYSQSRTPMQEMADYLGSHNYGREDYPTYSQDPTWKDLNDEILKADGKAPLQSEVTKAAPTLERPALERMSAYLSSHNYGRMDYPTYSQDPEWQKLNAALIAEDSRRTVGVQASQEKASAPAQQAGQGAAHTPVTATVDARSVDLSGAMGMDSSNFWNHHGNTKQDYMELASHLPEVQKGLAEGRTLEEMRSDPALKNTVAAYYDPDKMVKVEAREDGGYDFIDDGRHRVLAAQEMGCSIPVQVVNGEQLSSAPQQDTQFDPGKETGAKNLQTDEAKGSTVDRTNSTDNGIAEPTKSQETTPTGEDGKAETGEKGLSGTGPEQGNVQPVKEAPQQNQENAVAQPKNENLENGGKDQESGITQPENQNKDEAKGSTVGRTNSTDNGIAEPTKSQETTPTGEDGKAETGEKGLSGTGPEQGNVQPVKEAPQQNRENAVAQPKNENLENGGKDQESGITQPENQNKDEAKGSTVGRTNSTDNGITEPKKSQENTATAKDAGITDPAAKEKGAENQKDNGITEPTKSQESTAAAKDAGITEPAAKEKGAENQKDNGITEPKKSQENTGNAKDAGITEPDTSQNNTASQKDNGIRDTENSNAGKQSSNDHSQNNGIQY